MGSTFLSLHYHIVFATKNRKQWIANSWRHRLHEYLGGTIQGLAGIPQAIGGVEDHVHLLVGLRPTHHRRRSLVEELTSMLKEAEIDFDPKYLE